MGSMRFLAFLLSLLAAVGLTGCNSTPDAPALNITKNGAPAMWKVMGRGFGRAIATGEANRGKQR